jgi:undecaprenyl diphosphate synthase
MSEQLSSSPLDHLAVIMDGNGRWAQSHGRSRLFGHLKGTKVAKRIIEECARLKVPYLTLYAFSTENWLRPQEEVTFLMSLLSRYLERERQALVKNNINFSVVGDIARLPEHTRREIEKTIMVTKNNTGLKLLFALSYGGRQEIIKAAQLLAQEVAKGNLKPEDINEDSFQKNLSTYPIPDPDLIIRTSGESRMSNFLTWQSVYSELYITDTLWPNFTIADLHTALNNYKKRERRFGRVSAQLIESTI